MTRRPLSVTGYFREWGIFRIRPCARSLAACRDDVLPGIQKSSVCSFWHFSIPVQAGNGFPHGNLPHADSWIYHTSCRLSPAGDNVRDSVFIEDALHHFASIDVDLDKEREPCLQLHMHEAKMLIQVIEVVVFAFAVNITQFQPAIPVLHGLKRLAVFNNRKDTDQSLFHRVILSCECYWGI